MDKFFHNSIRELLSTGVISTSDSTLVVCGGQHDRSRLQEAKFINVTVSSLDDSCSRHDIAPYEWSHQDAEALTFDDDSYDFVLVHNGLHHCHSPHRAMLEMYRVARKGILVIENRDSLLLRFGAVLGLVPNYELEAVVANDMRCGGVANTNIPNYVYRWTEREVEKTMNSAHPEFQHQFRYFYDIALPFERLTLSRFAFKKVLVRILAPFAHLIFWLFPKQGNRFGFWVSKNGILHKPWIIDKGSGPTISHEYVEPRFKKPVEPMQ